MSQGEDELRVRPTLVPEPEDAPTRRKRHRLRWIARAALVGGVTALFLPFVYLQVFQIVPVRATPLMVIRSAQGEGWMQTWVPYEEISPYMPLAVLAAEDSHFCRHAGVDYEAVQRVLDEHREKNVRLRGASTISMQTAKNLFLWPSRDYVRKGLEFYLVHLVELAWSKRRIMEVYLNIVEFGPGVYGVEAAAQHHFNRSAADLDAHRAALLAAVLPNPRNRNASRPGPHVRGRANKIEKRMRRVRRRAVCLP